MFVSRLWVNFVLVARANNECGGDSFHSTVHRRFLLKSSVIDLDKNLEIHCHMKENQTFVFITSCLAEIVDY